VLVLLLLICLQQLSPPNPERRSNAAVAGVVAGADLIKLTTGVATTGLTVQQAFDAAIGTRP